ncbi:MAG: CPBP family intramembrane glutamic endopeptidase [Nocardioides sp.]
MTIESPLTGSAPERTRHHRRRTRLWQTIAGLEVLVATAAVLSDWLIPSVVLLLMAGLSLLARHEGPRSLGLRRVPAGPLALRMLVFAALWSLVQLGLTMPLANHISGTHQDLSGFADIEGDLGLLVLFLVLSWTLAAFVEELAFRGYLQTRMRDVLGHGRAGTVVAVLASSVLFGAVHSEQGLIGVLVVSLDAVAFSVVRYRYRTLWASILAHGFNNTIGFVAFYLVGPVYGLW